MKTSAEGKKIINEFQGTQDVYYMDWAKLIPLAKKLHDISKYQSVSFPDKTGYDIEVLYDECVDYILWLNKQK